jgi:hypothetical protein
VRGVAGAGAVQAREASETVRAQLAHERVQGVTLIRFEDRGPGQAASSIEYRAPYTFPIVRMGNRGTIRDNRRFTGRWPGRTGWAAIPAIPPDSGAAPAREYGG